MSKLLDSFTLNYSQFSQILKYESHYLGLPAEHIFIVNVENLASDEWINSTLLKDRSKILMKSPIPSFTQPLCYADLYLYLLEKTVK